MIVCGQADALYSNVSICDFSNRDCCAFGPRCVFDVLCVADAMVAFLYVTRQTTRFVNATLVENANLLLNSWQTANVVSRIAFMDSSDISGDR